MRYTNFGWRQATNHIFVGAIKVYYSVARSVMEPQWIKSGLQHVHGALPKMRRRRISGAGCTFSCKMLLNFCSHDFPRKLSNRCSQRSELTFNKMIFIWDPAAASVKLFVSARSIDTITANYYGLDKFILWQVAAAVAKKVHWYVHFQFVRLMPSGISWQIHFADI